MATLVMAAAREAARQQRQAEAEHRRHLRDLEAARRRAAREAAQAQKEAKAAYLESRAMEAEGLNQALKERMDELESILDHTLAFDDLITFNSLRINESFAPFELTYDLRPASRQPRREEFLASVDRPGPLRRLLPWVRWRHERDLQEAEQQYASAVEVSRHMERRRRAMLADAQKQHEVRRAAFEDRKAQRNREIDAFEAAYTSGDADAIIGYNNMVLERSEYPDGFPQAFRLAYAPDSKQLVVEYELPSADVIPTVAEYRFVKSREEITEKPRKHADRKHLYQDVVAAVALRTLHEVLEADQGGHLQVVCFNGFVETVDPATGMDIRPHVISARATREQFEQIDLARVDKRACLRNLGAQVSPRAAEAQPVKPVVDFDMVDNRFVDQSEVLGELESRPNLMDLNPYEFEHLVANLFQQMGLETKLTRSSRDGGVDCVAFDSRPVLGGKVVIQAKRYRHTVGVSAVRDLYGTMMNEGANKGILVTTSGYGPDAFGFSKDKPIELIDGGGLLYLLQQVGIEAQIRFPEDGVSSPA